MLKIQLIENIIPAWYSNFSLAYSKKDSMNLKSIIVALVIILTACTASAGTASGAYPFSEGSARVSLLIGGATAFNQDYSVFGIGGGYFVADHVEAGLEIDSWTGKSPGIQQVTPSLRYVFNRVGELRPYIGTFYELTHVESRRNYDSVGARAGALMQAGRSAWFGAGLVLDQHLNCDRTVFSSCSEVYPELSLMIMF
jgi:hypothetical protein